MDITPSEQCFIQLSCDLTHILREETQTLLSSDRQKLKQLIERKSVLAERYRSYMTAWQQRKKDNSQVTEAVKAATEHLRDAIQENETTIRAAISVSENYLHLFIAAVEEASKPARTYSAKAPQRKRRESQQALSVSLDHKL